jgi:enoyl-CoA hydratase
MEENMYETIEVNVADHIATLTLNRPDSRNALNLAMCRELTRACEALAGNADVHVVLVRAKGKVFCAGADLKERPGMSEQEMLARRVEGFTAYSALEDLPMPTIAEVQGPAFGSGSEIATSCDFILAGRSAAFRYPEVGWGTVGATQRMPRIVGVRMAKELLYTGRIVDCDEALTLGLVNHVYDDADLAARAMEMAQAIAKNNPLTTRMTKRSIDNGVETTRKGAMAVELLAIQENLRNSDWKKAIASFGKKPAEAGHDA